MSILELRNAVIADLRDHTGAKHAEAAPGRLDLREIRRRTFKTPAVFVSVLNISKVDPRGIDVEMTGRLAAYVVTLPKAAATRDEQAVELTAQIIHRMAKTGFHGQAQSPKNISARNLYAGKFEGANIALWAVTWDQAVTCPDSTVYAALDDLETFHGVFDIPPHTPDNHDEWAAGDETVKPDLSDTLEIEE